MARQWGRWETWNMKDKAKPATPAEVAALRRDYPEGLPPWVLARNYSAVEIRDTMELRRKAFPATKPGKPNVKAR